jgi:predicted ribosomally synthesized peptide with SipW-like signal peptide
MMSKILISLMTIALVGALVGGGIYAYFSDTETSTGNTFSAGTLDLNLDSGNTNVVKFNVSNASPGSSGGGTWTVTNAGTTDGYLDLETVGITQGIGTTTDPELVNEPTGLDNAQLGTYLMVHMFIDANNNGNWDAGETDILGTNATPVAINTIAGNYSLDLFLTASATNYVTLRWSVPVSADNRIQGDSVILGMTFDLQQRAAD